MIKVYKTMGSGHQERILSKAVAEQIRELGYEVDTEVPVEVKMGDRVLGKYRIDLLVNKNIIIEMKVGDRFKVKDLLQTKGYLTALGLKLAVLAYFSRSGVRWKRIVNLY